MSEIFEESRFFSEESREKPNRFLMRKARRREDSSSITEENEGSQKKSEGMGEIQEKSNGLSDNSKTNDSPSSEKQRKQLKMEKLNQSQRNSEESSQYSKRNAWEAQGDSKKRKSQESTQKEASCKNDEFQEEKSTQDKETIPLVVASEETYIVEKIRGKKKLGNRLFYLVKWEGYPESENTWEPVGNLKYCSKVIKEFEQRDTLDEIERKKKEERKEAQKQQLDLYSTDDLLPGETEKENPVSSQLEKRKREAPGRIEEKRERNPKNQEKREKFRKKLLKEINQKEKEERVMEGFEEEKKHKKHGKIQIESTGETGEAQKDDESEISESWSYIPVRIMNHKCMGSFEGNLKEKLVFQVEWIQRKEGVEDQRIMSMETREKVRSEFPCLLANYYEGFLQFTVEKNDKI